MSAPKTLMAGIGLPDGASLGRRMRHCPGALLRLTREDYAAMRRGGEVFSTSVHDLPASGRGDARVLCHQDVAEIRVPQYKRPDGRTVYAVYDAALCRSCAELERINRSSLTPPKDGGR